MGMPARSDQQKQIARRRLLLLAFYFPPLGGGGVQRAEKFAKYLPDFGFDPIVVTGPGQQRTRHAPLDTTLTSDARVVRVVHELPSDLGSRRLERLLARRSAFERAWMTSCRDTALRAAADGPIDVVLASMSPFETSEAAAAVAAQLGVPWVADLRDPWALDEMIVYPTRWHRTIDVRRMRRSLASADLIIMNTPEAARAVCDSFPELAERTIAITNGFDAEDFAGDGPGRGDHGFRIVHTGALHVALGKATSQRRSLRRWLGGERVPIDIGTRSHLYLLRALERWRAEAPEEVDRAELVLAGDASAADRDVVARSSVADRVRFLGYVSHAESVALLRSADLLFLPLHGLPPGERARIVPGKTYEYLAARRPILAAVPEGDARDYVLASGLGDVCDPHDVDGMRSVLRRRFAHKQLRQPLPSPPEGFLEQFERREITKRLAAALDTAIRRRSS